MAAVQEGEKSTLADNTAEGNKEEKMERGGHGGTAGQFGTVSQVGATLLSGKTTDSTLETCSGAAVGPRDEFYSTT